MSEAVTTTISVNSQELGTLEDLQRAADALKSPKIGGIAADRLRSIVERIERLHEERRELSGDIADVFSEAKSAGFDVKALKATLAKRRMDAADRTEHETLVDIYCHALGMV